MIKVFINGGSGTTGLRIAERLQARPDIELLTLPEERRKRVTAQAELAAQADITFLCLPAAIYITGECVAVDGGFLRYGF